MHGIKAGDWLGAGEFVGVVSMQQEEGNLPDPKARQIGSGRRRVSC